MTDDELTPQQADALSKARQPIPPPAALEDQAVMLLRQRGLLGRRPLGRAATWIAIAASLIALAGWFAVRRPAAPAQGPRFVLLLYGGAGFHAGEPASRREEYGAWARDLTSRGIAISGEELGSETAQIGGVALEPEPRGFFIVRAADLAAAQAIATTCPHVRYGGRIVIKPIV